MFGAKRIFQLMWLASFVVELIVAIGAGLLLPGGFPLSHPRFWSNSVAPPSAGLLAIVSLWVLHHQPLARLRVLLVARMAIWTGLMVTAAMLFPVTLVGFWVLAAVIGLIVAITGLITGIVTARVSSVPRKHAKTRVIDLWLALPCVLIGVGLAWTQKPPEGHTHPLFGSDARLHTPYGLGDKPTTGVIAFHSRAMVQTSDASLTVRMPPLTLSLQPLLTFLERSPDGAPTVLVGAQFREPRRLNFRGLMRRSETAASLRYDVSGQGQASLTVEEQPDGTLDVESMCQLTETVFSHLNSFCDFEIRGHSLLALVFSPCPSTAIEVLPFDYPFGRPARFAFVDSARNFRVVQATNSEKGPFYDLASGRLEADQPLTITLLSAGTPVGRITLDDWSAQADTTLSPTAGWGVPVNAIEFSRSGETATSPASIFVTLAGTSVGRGWDTVPHRAGLYRNRVHFGPVAPAAEHRLQKQKPEPTPSL